MNSDLYFEGKKFISARRAAETSGYSTDYIGQLCRAGNLKCKMVGRSWFVLESSLAEYQNSFLKEQGKILSESNFVSETASSIQKIEEVEICKKDEISFSRDIRDSFNLHDHFVYTSDNRPLVPELKNFKNNGTAET